MHGGASGAARESRAHGGREEGRPAAAVSAPPVPIAEGRERRDRQVASKAPFPSSCLPRSEKVAISICTSYRSFNADVMNF